MLESRIHGVAEQVLGEASYFSDCDRGGPGSGQYAGRCLPATGGASETQPTGDKPKIVKILDVVDTRQYEEIGDRFVPIAGSGDSSSCERCGREHEVHAYVQLDDGTTAVVGTTCMTASGMDAGICKELTSRAAAAKTAKRLEAELAKAEKDLVRLRQIDAEVEALPLPSIESGWRDSKDGGRIPTLKMGDAEVWCPGSAGCADPERRNTLIGAWRDNRFRERGGKTYEINSTDVLAKYLRGRLETAMARAHGTANP